MGVLVDLAGGFRKPLIDSPAHLSKIPLISKPKSFRGCSDVDKTPLGCLGEPHRGPQEAENGNLIVYQWVKVEGEMKQFSHVG